MTDIARGVRSFAAGTALSRVMGVVREAVLAALFGAGMASDAFRAAFRIPNLLRDLFAEHALSSAFVPVLTDQKMAGREAFNRFASNVLNALLLVVGLVSAVGAAAAPWLARLIASGFESVPGKTELTARLASVMFPFLLFIALAAWAMSLLNVEGDFFIPSAAPAAFNLFSILVPLALYGALRARGIDPVFGAAIGVTLGGLMQFVVQAVRLRRHGFRYRSVLSFRDRAFRQALSLFVPVAIALSGSRVSYFVTTMLVTSLPQGSLSWLEYAYRIMHLPIGLFGIGVGTVRLPAFARLAAEGRAEEIRGSLLDSLKMVFFLTAPVSAVLAALASPVTSLVYERHRFGPEDTAATAAVLVLYLVGVPFISAIRNVASVFLAYKDTRLPLIASLGGVALTLAVNLSLMGLIGLKAFPIAASAAGLFNLGLLLAWLPKKIGPIDLRSLVPYGIRLVFASLAGGAAAWAAYRFGAISVAGTATPGAVIKTALILGSAGLGAAAFYGVALLAGLREARLFVGRFLRRPQRRTAA